MKSVNELAFEYCASGDYDALLKLSKEHSIPEERVDQYWNGMISNLADEANDGTAAGKIDGELKDFSGGSKEKAVSNHVAKTIKSFCKNPKFEAAVLGSKKTLSDCCKSIMQGVGSSISDIEVYRRAAKFYFPGAVVKFNMQIEVDGSASDAELAETYLPPIKAAAAASKKPKQKAPPDVIQVSLFD